MGARHWYLVSYDIRDPKRWREAYRELQGRGERIQYSFFRCRLTRTEIEALRWELERILADEDDLIFVHLCPGCASRVRERGKTNTWEPPIDRFDIV